VPSGSGSGRRKSQSLDGPGNEVGVYLRALERAHLVEPLVLPAEEEVQQKAAGATPGDGPLVNP
jgi:hypothetical protein